MKQENQFFQLVESSPDAIFIGARGCFVYLNPAALTLFGAASPDQLLGQAIIERIHPDDRPVIQERIKRLYDHGEEAPLLEQTYLRVDGSPVAVEVSGVPFPYHGETGGLVFVRDVTQRKRAEEEVRVLHQNLEDRVRERTRELHAKEELLREAHSLNDNILMTCPVGILTYRQDGQCVLANPAAASVVGGTVEKLLQQNYRHIEPWKTTGLLAAAERALSTGTHVTMEARYTSTFGRDIWVEAHFSAFESRGERHLLAMLHDITEMRRKDERIYHLAFHDALTCLPNRTLMLDRLQHALARSQRENTRLAVIFMDLDRFKEVNDVLGHNIGDLLLQEVAQRINGRLRAMDTVARLGGDEFVVLIEALGEADYCAGLAQDLIAEISRPIELQGHRVEIGVSIGMAFYPDDGADSLELMKRADMAMYAAKAAGRNTFRLFQQTMLDTISQRLSMEMDLRRAILNDELELHYQPKVTLSTGLLLGVEALVRWRHPSRGFLPPTEFIPLAEESGLIVDIGKWVLNEACRQAALWQGAGLGIKIAINVSARELDSGDLVDRIVEYAARHGITPADLEIELTETAVMANPYKAAGVFARLRELGTTVAVDDFGTGYSSLAYLRRLPIDVLKIDRSFVMNADRDEEEAQIVKTIFTLGQALKLNVVAEGIETCGQAEVLRSFGCDMAQGYLFSRPLPAQELEIWLGSSNLSHRARPDFCDFSI